MGRYPDKPENCTELTTYPGLQWFAEGWIRRCLGNPILVGHTGIGKTETMRKVAGDDHLLIQGVASGVNVYRQVHEWVVAQQNDGPIILDDADPVFRTPSGQTFMKEMILDKPNRRVSWGTDYSKLSKNDIPPQFQMVIAEHEMGRPNPEGNWQRMIMKKLVKPAELESALLFCDEYPSNAARAKAFQQRGLGSARTFYRHIKKLRLASKGECDEAIAALEAEEERLKTAIMVMPA